MYLLERKCFVLPSQRGTFYAGSLLFSSSLRNSWAVGPQFFREQSASVHLPLRAHQDSCRVRYVERPVCSGSPMLSTALEGSYSHLWGVHFLHTRHPVAAPIPWPDRDHYPRPHSVGSLPQSDLLLAGQLWLHGPG